MTSSSDSSTRAFALGAASGLRTFGALGPLGARGRLAGRAGRYAFPALLAGELAGDKHPAIPARSDPPAVAGRLAAGAVAGRTVAGLTGAGLGAAGAAATTYLSEAVRGTVGEHFGVPDPVLGVTEDMIAIAIATAAVPDDEPESRAKADGASPDAAPAPPSRAATAVRGLLACAVGTAAMTTAQTVFQKATGTEPSDAPEQVGRRILRRVGNQRVPRGQRPALNQGMHFLYGASWGLPLGLIAQDDSVWPVRGLALGAAVWAVSLFELPALELSPQPWERSPVSLGSELAFHLVYGAVAGAAYDAMA